MAHRPRKKPLDFGDNPDNVTSKLGLGSYGYATIRWHRRVCYPALNRPSSNFATSADSVEVCAQLSAVLVDIVCSM